MDFARTLKALKDSGFTQQQIADACGCTQSTISEIARGKNVRPNFMVVDGIRRLAQKKCVRAKLRAPEERAESATAGAGQEG